MPRDHFIAITLRNSVRDLSREGLQWKARRALGRVLAGLVAESPTRAGEGHARVWVPGLPGCWVAGVLEIQLTGYPAIPVFAPMHRGYERAGSYHILSRIPTLLPSEK